jgi:hypothetical protein
MPTYAPVLKAKPGEITAWREASPAVKSKCRVTFEIAPTNGPDRDLSDFVSRLTVTPTTVGRQVTVDAGYLDPTVMIGSTAMRPIEWLSDQLASRSFRYVPVIRLDDDPAVYADAATAHSLHGVGACLRLGSDEDDPNPVAAGSALPGILAATGLGVHEIDLLIDMWTVADARSVRRATPVAVGVVQWAASMGSWRSITVLSGAFPDSISNLAKNTSTPLTRWDASLWSSVAALRGVAPVPDFGDYGVAHPSLPSPAPRGPLPNLRYTYGNEWWVWREEKVLPGNESFYTLCDRVRSSAAWPPSGGAYCWGDSQIDRCANSIPGPGTATQWRSYGTSHHLQTVVDRLTTTGAP